MSDSLASSSIQQDTRSCALCTTPARYKCPRCATPTCSLPCSRKHKQGTGCSGERDKAQYVPMNAYGWGTMMRDYCYLEEVGRKVSEWGSEIVRGGYSLENSGKKGVHGRSAGRRPPTKRKPTTAKSKRDILKGHLEALDIDVEFLTTGMERRNMNRSSFDQKSKCPLLTVEFVFHPPTTYASPPPPSHTIISHRNDLSATLLDLLQHQASSCLSKSQKQKENTFPDWIPPIIYPHPDAPENFVPPHCYIGAHVEFPHAPNAKYYHRLDPTITFSELLRRTSFVEFPTIHVFDPEASSFCGTVIDKSGSIARLTQEDEGNLARVVKRRKLSKEGGRKAIVNLLGGYASESGSQSEGETENRHFAGLATLEAYADSNDEELPANAETEDGSEDDATSYSETEVARLDPERLLELVKQARNAADEDILDWGDEWDVDAEG